MTKRFLTLLLISIITIQVHSQVEMGKWRTHFSYNIVNQISMSENKVFAVSEGSLLSVDKRDGNLEFYSKISGLNGSAISKIKYDNNNKVLIITYQDGNIDFMDKGGVINLPDLYAKQISVDKNVNDILIANDKAYLSCNFGIITLNIKKREIQDTYFIGADASNIKVNNTTILGDKIYATTDDAIYQADVNDKQIIDYNKWSTLKNIKGSGKFQLLYSFEDKLVLLRGNKLYYKTKDSSIWNSLNPTHNYTSIISGKEYIQAYTKDAVYVYDKNMQESKIDGVQNITHGEYDYKNKKFWFSGDSRGIAEYTPNNGNTPSYNFYKADGPAINLPYLIKFAGEKLFVVPGGRWASQFNKDGQVMIFENNKWKSITNKSIKDQTKNVVKDFVSVVVDPKDNKHFFATSYGNGIFEFKNDEFYKWHNFTNSTIETIFPGKPVQYLYMRIGDGAYDKDGNIWFTNTNSNYTFKILTKSGEWKQLGNNITADVPTVGQIIHLKNGLKWVLSVRSTPGIIVVDDNNTIDNKEDDRYKFFKFFIDNIKGGTIIPSKFMCIAEDKNATVWVGTDRGPILFNNTKDAFNKDYTFSRVIIPRNDGTGVGDILLENETVKAIAIDGANRKWIGTESSGIYLLSENGQETIQHFTTGNSPITSNDILSISINPISGEVFFGTSSGLFSYQGDAAVGSDDFSNLHVYPNPIRENFDGLITITGLVENTQVKITDVAGNLVFEGVSNGSISTWDGKYKNGTKVSTGVYIVICTNKDGQQSKSTKILVIN